MKNRLDISEQTAISMPMKNLLAIISAVAVGVWAYFGVLERITMLETKAQLSEKDLNQVTETLSADIEKNNEFNEDYLKNETVMSEKEKKALVEKIQGIEKKFRSGQEKIQADLQKVQQEELSRIRAIVEKAITDHAEKNDFDIIIRADGTTLYAKKYINITQEIISKLQ